MTDANLGNIENYFDHDTNIGIIGRGETVEICFCDMAKTLFSLRMTISNVHLIQIITFEFEEENVELALVRWLNLLIEKASEHHLIFGDFRLKHEGTNWKATASGEPWRENLESGIKVQGVLPTGVSVKKIDHLWEARCVVDV